tara:strand:+ start:370 stop:567 length:198 start_codon:yes stop_codon:yes gene_type:complete
MPFMQNKLPHYKIDESLLIPKENKKTNCKKISCGIGSIIGVCGGFLIFMLHEMNESYDIYNLTHS